MLFLAAMFLSGCAEEPAPQPLPTLQIDPARVTTSGISSGAYMAVQAHVVLSKQIRGVASIAGGAYGCAQGSLETALSTCIKGTPTADIDRLAATTRDRAAAGTIDPLDGLADDPVFIVHGKDDTIVAPEVSAAAVAWYRTLAPTATIIEQRDEPFGHLWPTASPGPCAADATYVSDCGNNLAALVLQTLAPASSGQVPSAPGQLMRFDQNLGADAATSAQMADTGYLYVPAACVSGTCGLHIVFHGCEMNASTIGERFVGLPDWHRAADVAHVVVLYPQTKASFVPLNPKGCWDWWGYTGNRYDTRDGAQLRWLTAVLRHFGV